MQGGTATPNREFWNGRRVLVVGNTGFKGSWLSLWLHGLGARVAGLSLPPPTEPSLFALAGLSDLVPTVLADIRDLAAVRATIRELRPEIVFHLAAQSLVRVSYRAGRDLRDQRHGHRARAGGGPRGPDGPPWSW